MENQVYGVLSIIPPLIAIGMAIATRKIIISLLVGIWTGWVIHAGGNPLVGSAETIEAMIHVFTDAGETRIIIFTMLMGTLLLLMKRSGGIDGFIKWVSRWAWSNSRKGVQLLTTFIGLGIFFDGSITCLVSGTVSRPLYDRLKISREKLAYICDSMSAPVSLFIPFNSWGALILMLLAGQAAAGNLGDETPLSIFIATIPLNFYVLVTVPMVFIVVLTNWNFGPMKEAERRASEEGKVLADGAMPMVDDEIIKINMKEGVEPLLRNMMVPLVGMVMMLIIGLAITGISGAKAKGIVDPDIMDYFNNAVASTAVLWAVITAVLLNLILTLQQKIFSLKEIGDLSLKGSSGMLPIAILLVLSFAIGDVCDALGTGIWAAAQIQPLLTPVLVAPLVFVVTAAIAFSTGTSWGTFAIMISLAVPLVASFNADAAVVSLPLVVSAVLGGGVFGDHCSPISDTSVIASMAAASDHMDHVRTQLPYALVAGGITTILYFIAGIL
ncbi:MAG: sodium:solute symporter [Kordiimonadaceae bacterium]|jgi:tetracycline resistance efflux pump|nr:sodium:solute symporter [Kordiimonadaceae bacterium]MBT6034870.1 sodium:solute symporter [Kordiimonadaceae bacterium]MBT6328889.1 sodium:solute symporter [Kordiimonadaceae bacterium]